MEVGSTGAYSTVSKQKWVLLSTGGISVQGHTPPTTPTEPFQFAGPFSRRPSRPNAICSEIAANVGQMFLSLNK